MRAGREWAEHLAHGAIGSFPRDSAVVDSPDGRALVLNFTTKGIAPGAYRIRQVGVSCGRDFIRSSGIDIPVN
jgi:hypothetical protein